MISLDLLASKYLSTNIQIIVSAKSSSYYYYWTRRHEMTSASVIQIPTTTTTTPPMFQIDEIKTVITHSFLKLEP